MLRMADPRAWGNDMAVSKTAEEYRDALLSLLPRGDAWPTDLDSNMAKLMFGIAEEFARIDARAMSVIRESHPSTAFELFKEWEQMYALPHSCSGNDPSFQERRQALIQAYRANGGQSRQFFITLAALLGFTITITEYQERTFGNDLGGPFGGEEWNYVWQVNTSLNNYAERSFGEPYGEYYRTWGNQRLECLFNRLVHSHRHIIFSYT